METEKPQFKGRVKTFIQYLFYFPITERIRVPNYRTFLWIFLLISIFFKYTLITLGLLLILLVIYILDEYKSKRYIDWYRSRKYKDRKEALKKVKKERELNNINEKIISRELYSSGDENEGQGGSEDSPNPHLLSKLDDKDINNINS